MFNSDISNICKNISFNEPMDRHSSFNAGGKAKYYAKSVNIEEFQGLIKYAIKNGIDYYFIGKGSNILVSDRGYDGLIIALSSDFSDMEVSGNKITAQAGAAMSAVSKLAVQNSLSGFEGLGGIPGSIGGAVAMNAGAYGYEMLNVLKKVSFLDDRAEFRELPVEELDMGYRHSIFTDNKYLVLSAELLLEQGNRADILEKMEDFKQRRNASQPLNYASAGSTFKRPEGYFAGKLIQDSGLKGVSVGAACVSKKHAGFVVNKGGATADDIYELICYIISKVYADSGVILEPEVRLIGDFE